MATVKKPIKKAQNGLEDLKKKEDSLYTANRKLVAEKAAENAGYLDQQRSLKAKLNEAAKNRNAKLPKQKNGGSVKAKDGKKWIQKAINPAHKGYCTPQTKATCTPKRKAVAQTLRKIAKKK